MISNSELSDGSCGGSGSLLRPLKLSEFWLGIYGYLWGIAWDYLVDIVQQIINLNPHKKSHYQRGLK
ncbi:MAG: hypothetical protein F6K05_30550, partial [Okeania sp. SIO1H2]|nr:hypothetical protein [Okeania sp. SIO1H2]